MKARLAALALLVACAGGPSAPELPPGAALAGDGPALADLLDTLAAFEGTPLASAIEAAGADPRSCAQVEGRAPAFAVDALLANLRCVDAIDPGLVAAKGDADLVLTVPAGDAHAVVRMSGHRVDAVVPAGALPPLLAGLQPGSGAAVLAHDGALLHARFRTGGIARTVAAAAEGQGERLFALGSSVLVGSVLDGRVEAAWYAPAEGDAVPPLVVALGATSRAAAAEGTARYVDALKERWPITTRAVGDGQCLDGLRVLPGFAPCWRTYAQGVVLAWNEATLDRATASAGGPVDGAVLRVDRFADADATLRRARGVEGTSPAYPWRRLDVAADLDGDLTLSITLEPAP